MGAKGRARWAAAGLLSTVGWQAFVVTRLAGQSPGYDAWHSSLSRLGETGSPGALSFAAALALLALAVLGSGFALRSIPVAVAGALLLGTALVPVSPSWPITVLHRSLTGAALAALLAGALVAARRESGWFGAVSKVAGALGLVLAVCAAGLLVPGFPAGLWERVFFGVLLLWLELGLLQFRAKRSGPRAAS